MMETQIYSKIEILMIIGEIATTKIEFTNSSFILQGNHLIIITKKDDNTQTMCVFGLDEIAGYKTYNNK